MTNTIEIKLDDAALRARLNSLMGALTNTKPLMASIANELLVQTERAFDDEGPGWPQLKPSTVKRRGSAHPILEVSNALALSVTPNSGENYALISSNKDYAAIHQFGGTIKRKGKAGSVRLQTDAKGNLLRQRKHKNLAVFAKQDHEHYTERNYQGKDYSIEIPARPFLPITPDGQLKPTALDAVMGVLQQFLTKP